MPITEVDSGPGRPSPISSRLLVLTIAGVVSLLLIYAGGAGFARALKSLPATAVLDDLGRGHAVDAERATAARLALSRVDEPSGAELKQRGQLALREALIQGLAEPASLAALRNARQWLASGLARAPGDGYAWLWLTQAEFLLKGHTSMATRALDASLNQSRNDRFLYLEQIDYGLLLWPILNAASRAEILGRLSAVALVDQRGAARISRRRGGIAVERFRQALAGDAKRLGAYEYWLKKE